MSSKLTSSLKKLQYPKTPNTAKSLYSSIQRAEPDSQQQRYIDGKIIDLDSYVSYYDFLVISNQDHLGLLFIRNMEVNVQFL
jgi:hypothetical protein